MAKEGHTHTIFCTDKKREGERGLKEKQIIHILHTKKKSMQQYTGTRFKTISFHTQMINQVKSIIKKKKSNAFHKQDKSTDKEHFEHMHLYQYIYKVIDL